MREALGAAVDVAGTATTVLLLGESGTGKEVLARYLHLRSTRSAGPWVAVNCAALPGELLESELFGHERGAFTGASERRAGRFEQAHRGTLLLDEISELPLRLQAKLLRAIQEREIDRVGGRQPIPVDVRLIATSNRDLAEMVRRGLFRSDLYYRLNVFPIVVPALRDRREDLPALCAQLLAEAAGSAGRPAPRLSASALEALAEEPFPGNVRELRNLLERAVVRCRGEVIEAADLRRVGATARALGGAAASASATLIATSTSTPTPAPSSSSTFPVHLPLDLAHLERLAIEEALRRMNGNRTHAARLLGIGLRTLRNKLRTWREETSHGPADPAARHLLPCAEAEDADENPTPSLGLSGARGSHEEQA
jgi:two-component system, response regulator FlrC